MVNGKPQLIMGGGASAPASSRQRAQSTLKGAESFASYLPGGNAGQVARHGSSPAAGPPLARPAAPADSRSYLGLMPNGYAANQITDYTARQAAPQPAQPAGTRTMAQARPQALPGSQAMLNNFGTMMGANQRLATRGAPQLSGAPVTGRGGFGMVDTRRTVAQPVGNRDGIATQTVLPGAVSPPGSDPYASFTAYYGGVQPAQSRQSFVTHGFASKNAELAMKKLGYDMKQAPSLQTYARRLEPDPYSLKPTPTAADTGVSFGSTRPVRFPSGEEGGRTAVLTASHRKKEEAAATSLTPTFRAMADQGLGRLAAKFESGDEGIAAIGYDRKGGTSYGKYQIASRVGTMRGFIDYLHDKAPDLAKRLEAAGPANTGGRSGRMPNEWRTIAAENPERFETLQSDFIRNSHFEPAKQAIAAATGVAFDSMPQALQEVLFSTAVQHGPAGATRIVSQALRRTGADKLQSAEKQAEEQLITHIYNLRAGQFVSSTSRVQAAVRQRLKQEMREALQMLT